MLMLTLAACGSRRAVRGAAGAAATVTAAKSKVMSHRRASSCNFMGTPNAAEDDVMLAYRAQ